MELNTIRSEPSLRDHVEKGYYKGTSPIRKHPTLGPYLRPTPRVVGGSQGGGRFLMGEVPLHRVTAPALPTPYISVA